MNARPAGCALVTGASRGIGAAIARGLAEDGWPVGVNYRKDSEGADRVVEEIEGAGGSALALQADVSDPDAADALFGALEERFGPVLVLVNNAGMRDDGLSPQLADAAWDRVIDLNLTAPSPPASSRPSSRRASATRFSRPSPRGGPARPRRSPPASASWPPTGPRTLTGPP